MSCKSVPCVQTIFENTSSVRENVSPRLQCYRSSVFYKRGREKILRQRCCAAFTLYNVDITSSSTHNAYTATARKEKEWLLFDRRIFARRPDSILHYRTYYILYRDTFIKWRITTSVSRDPGNTITFFNHRALTGDGGTFRAVSYIILLCVKTQYYTTCTNVTLDYNCHNIHTRDLPPPQVKIYVHLLSVGLLQPGPEDV